MTEKSQAMSPTASNGQGAAGGGSVSDTTVRDAFQTWWKTARGVTAATAFSAGWAARDQQVEALLRTIEHDGELLLQFGGRPIACSERMPEPDPAMPMYSVDVLAWNQKEWQISFWIFSGNRWADDLKATHWLPMPPSPGVQS